VRTAKGTRSSAPRRRVRQRPAGRRHRPASTYVTNVVKHFYFEERGKRRIHQRPDARAINACRPWFDAELDVVGPEALVILGATAGKALLGSKFRLTDQRGRPLESDLAPPRREQSLATFVRVSPGSTLAQGGARAQVGIDDRPLSFVRSGRDAGIRVGTRLRPKPARSSRG